jgi:hypothetical protein
MQCEQFEFIIRIFRLLQMPFDASIAARHLQDANGTFELWTIDNLPVLLDKE